MRKMCGVLLVSLSLAALAFRHAPPPGCDDDNGGLTLASGFCASVFADVKGARHIAVAPNGDVFVASAAGVTVLRDTNHDGKADSTTTFGPGGGTGIAIGTDAIYYAPNDRVLRYPWRAGAMLPAGDSVAVVTGLPVGGHTAKPIALSKDGWLIVDHGSASNSCQERDRQKGSAGKMPCPELPVRAGLWRYRANGTAQTPAQGEHWATGMRNMMAIAFDPATGTLYGATHGRDNLSSAWGFSDLDNAEKPAEEFGPIAKGADYGWPYCYYDPIAKKKVQAPEYGGDGVKQGDCAAKTQPAVAFPGHWAPLQLAFNTGTLFGASYRGGAFLAFHGSWNRAPLPQDGFRIAFIPFVNGKPDGSYSTFAQGAKSQIKLSGVAMSADGGALYIGSDTQGRIWRIRNISTSRP